MPFLFFRELQPAQNRSYAFLDALASLAFKLSVTELLTESYFVRAAVSTVHRVSTISRDSKISRVMMIVFLVTQQQQRKNLLGDIKSEGLQQAAVRS